GAAYAPWLDAGGTLASNAIAPRLTEDLISDQFDIERDDNRGGERGEGSKPSRRYQRLHLSSVCREHHQRHDGKRQGQAHYHLTEDQELCRPGPPVPDRDDGGRPDRNRAGGGPPRPSPTAN